MEAALRYGALLIGGFLLGTFLGHLSADAAPLTSYDQPSYTFNYRGPEELKITVNAESRCAAYKKAAKMCYGILSGGRYPGEERGMDIIDICANPINYHP